MIVSGLESRILPNIIYQYFSSFNLDINIRSIKTLGDTLSDKGFLYAGQFCYIMAELDFSSYANKNSKLVLIGGKTIISRLLYVF